MTTGDGECVTPCPPSLHTDVDSVLFSIYICSVKIFTEPLHFEWDRGNRDKNWRAHRVTPEECEEAFYDPQKRVLHDVLHSGHEERYLLIGATKQRRLLFIVFTVRDRKLRVISARDLNRKERSLYEENP